MFTSGNVIATSNGDVDRRKFKSGRCAVGFCTVIFTVVVIKLGWQAVRQNWVKYHFLSTPSSGLLSFLSICNHPADKLFFHK